MIKKKSLIKYLIFIGLFILLHYIGLLKPVENIFLKNIKPVGGYFFSATNYFNSIYLRQIEKIDYSQEIKKIKENNEKLMVENSRLKNLEQENEKLRQHLKFAEQNEMRQIMAHVISRNTLGGFSHEEVIVIDKGRNQGIENGMAVINNQGIIVAKITETKDEISEAILITSSACKLAASVNNKNQTVGLTEGEHGLTIKMNFIPQTESLFLEDLVVSSGLEEKIPRGLLIGKIIEVKNDSSEVWQSATIEPLVDLNNLIIVSVVAF